MTLTEKFSLTDRFDSVVLLTWSNWRTEMRSNRYHYSIRFARNLPVLFVQPDLQEKSYRFESTEVENIVILHVSCVYGQVQNRLLRRALAERGIKKPLLWIYNVHFVDFVVNFRAPLKIYHATEDYFTPDFMVLSGTKEIRRKLKWILAFSQLLVTVSEGVREDYFQKGKYSGESLVLENGCDFSYWGLKPVEIQHLITRKTKRAALYQGGISHKIDFPLLENLVTHMPDWEFWFCGEFFNCFDEWDALLKHKNVRYFGKLHPDEVRKLSLEAMVGLIPFLQNDWIIERSSPLKAFEYAACGLPVVTVPIKSLLTFPRIFSFATNAVEFMEEIQQAIASRADVEKIALRLEAARGQDYDQRFEKLLCRIGSLYDKDHLEAPENKTRRTFGVTERDIKRIGIQAKKTRAYWSVLIYRAGQRITYLIQLLNQMVWWASRLARWAFMLFGFFLILMRMFLSIKILLEILLNYIRQPDIRKALGPLSYVKSLFVLGMVKRAMTMSLEGEHWFRVVVQINPEAGSILFTSVAITDGKSVLTPPWSSVESALRNTVIHQMSWDHAVTGSYVFYPFIGSKRFTVPLGNNSVFSLDVLAYGMVKAGSK